MAPSAYEPASHPLPLRASEPEYDEHGVDLTLLRWMASLTPTERLRVLQANVIALQRLRDGRSRP